MTRNIKFRQAWLAAAIFAAAGSFASTAKADDAGYYVRAWVGLTGLGTDDLTLNEDGTQSTASTDFSAGFTGGGAFGYRYGERWRVEVDATYRSAEVDRIQFAGGETFTDGNFASLVIGLTGIYDLRPLGQGRNWKPYLGLGLGYVQEVDIDFEDASGETSFSSDDVALTALGGIRYESGQRWFVDGEIRYLSLGDLDLDGESAGIGTVTADYDPLSFTFGFGWNF